MEKVSELQKRRAENIIWTAADSYSFTPDFKAYDKDGCADIYWNCIIGAVRRHYEYPKIEELFRGLQQYEDSDDYEALLWLGLENCVQMPEKEVLCQFPLIHDFSLTAYAIPIPLLHRENGFEARPHGM